MHFATKAIVMAAALVFAASAGAQPRPGGGPAPGSAPAPGGGPSGGGGAAAMITQYNAEQLAQLFTAAGFQSKVIDNNNVHMVQIVFWSEDVFSGAIPLYCDKNDNTKCYGIGIFANLGKDSGVDQKWVNAWNSRFFFVRSYIQDDGSLIFDWDVLLTPGATADYVKETAQVFKAQVDASTDFKP